MRFDLEDIEHIDDRVDALIKALTAAEVHSEGAIENSQGGVHAYTLTLHFQDCVLRNDLRNLLGGASPYDIGSPFPEGW